uniref:RNA helicase n=1 Tax=Gouania willdenowi TaxID=441366 RepID=A0A8C5NHH9_GOUWI
MASESDEKQVQLIEFFRSRLCQYIDVEQVVDRIQFIDREQKEKIRQKAKNDGNLSAVTLLLTAVQKKPHSLGWFRDFVDALHHGGSGFAADYLEQKLPDPEEEAENDTCVKFIELLAPDLTDMKTEVVALECMSQKLLTQEEFDRVKAKTETEGQRYGASELLRRIVKRRPGWYSKFVEILQKTEHKFLHQLTGGLIDQGDYLNNPMAVMRPHQDFTLKVIFYLNKKKNIYIYFICISSASDIYSLITLEVNTSEPVSLLNSSDVEQGSETADIVLRDYQMEVARPALEGKNIIVCLPTGSGKTRVAVYITKAHLDSRRAEKKPCKVVVLVNKVPLVEQHSKAEFKRYLEPNYKIEKVSGDSPLKISFSEIVKQNDVIICTAQILENSLAIPNNGDDEGINLSDITLMVIDECHHTQKGEVYNLIMMRYLKLKHKNHIRKKAEKKPLPLPQILGLTASPGVGKATKMKQAEEHIMRICANMDAFKIMTSDLESNKKEQRRQITLVENRKEDPFGNVIKNIMQAIHSHAKLSPTCELDSQMYEQWAVQIGRKAEKEGDQTVRVCADHLQQYYEGLNLCNTIRMCDAYNFLNKFYEDKLKEKKDEKHKIQITETERFLFNLFQENKKELETLSKIPKYENDSLSKLRKAVLYEFSTRDGARGIVFTKTRRSAIALNQWIQENSRFDDIGVKPAYVIGGGDQSVVKPMTSAEQKDVLKKFANGDVNLLIATAVAEEGLDIAACNFVIRYGHVTNEIAKIQAEGRGRAEDSSLILVEVKNSGVAGKEFVNEFRIKLMTKAIDKIRKMKQEDYESQITEFQYQSILEDKVRTKKKGKEEIRKCKPSDVKLLCQGCSIEVCSGDDIKIIDKMHRVNVTKEFEKLFIRRENTSLQERLLDYETNGYIACLNCGARWGSMMVFRSIEIPCLLVENFVVNVNGQNISKRKKWSEVPVEFSAFNYTEHASQVTQSDDDDDIDSD